MNKAGNYIICLHKH